MIANHGLYAMASWKMMRGFCCSFFLSFFLSLFLPFFLFFLCLFRATPMAHGSSQARGPIGATAAGLHHSHSNARSKPRL